MIKSSYQFFRLRKKEQIVGYLRYISSSKPYFSKDKLWWKATPIEYDQKDTYIELNDINQQWLFENDIVEMKLLSKRKKINTVFVYDDEVYDFVAIQCDNLKKIYRKDWGNYRMKLVSYLFVNPDLEATLKGDL